MGAECWKTYLETNTAHPARGHYKVDVSQLTRSTLLELLLRVASAVWLRSDGARIAIFVSHLLLALFLDSFSFDMMISARVGEVYMCKYCSVLLLLLYLAINSTVWV
jgi:hypothetical protein